MKKLLLVLGIITCMGALTACGEQGQEQSNLMASQDIAQYSENLFKDFEQVVQLHLEDDFIAMLEQSGWNAAVMQSALDSWEAASEDMGDYIEIIEVTENSMVGAVYNGGAYPVEGTAVIKIKGTKHNANVEIIYENNIPVSISTNVEYTLAENMEKAGLNTLLGMGTVFVILILISLIISAFGLISKAQKSDKKAKEPEKKVDNVVAQIMEKEELSDDLELVAVISAAIAAYEGSGSTDGFVVRSIRKARR